jgi:hypothetical protein
MRLRPERKVLQVPRLPDGSTARADAGLSRFPEEDLG